MWFKVYADGSEIDIIYANNPREAIMIAKMRHGECDNWSYRIY